MNKPKLNLSQFGVTCKYSHADRGHWIEVNHGAETKREFVKDRHLAEAKFNQWVRANLARGVRAI